MNLRARVERLRARAEAQLSADVFAWSQRFGAWVWANNPEDEARAYLRVVMAHWGAGTAEDNARLYGERTPDDEAIADRIDAQLPREIVADFERLIARAGRIDP